MYTENFKCPTVKPLQAGQDNDKVFSWFQHSRMLIRNVFTPLMKSLPGHRDEMKEVKFNEDKKNNVF